MGKESVCVCVCVRERERPEIRGDEVFMFPLTSQKLYELNQSWRDVPLWVTEFEVCRF
jgi:hypothetical protein